MPENRYDPDKSFTIYNKPDPRDTLKFESWEEKVLILVEAKARTIWKRYKSYFPGKPGEPYGKNLADIHKKSKISPKLRKTIFKDTPQHPRKHLLWIFNKFTGRHSKLRHVYAPYACDIKGNFYRDFAWAKKAVDLSMNIEEWVLEDGNKDVAAAIPAIEAGRIISETEHSGVTRIVEISLVENRKVDSPLSIAQQAASTPVSSKALQDTATHNGKTSSDLDHALSLTPRTSSLGAKRPSSKTKGRAPSLQHPEKIHARTPTLDRSSHTGRELIIQSQGRNCTDEELKSEKLWLMNVAKRIIMYRSKQKIEGLTPELDRHDQLSEMLYDHATRLLPIPSNALCWRRVKSQVPKRGKVDNRANWWRKVAGVIYEGYAVLRIDDDPHRQRSASRYKDLHGAIMKHANLIAADNEDLEVRPRAKGEQVVETG